MVYSEGSEGFGMGNARVNMIPFVGEVEGQGPAPRHYGGKNRVLKIIRRGRRDS